MAAYRARDAAPRRTDTKQAKEYQHPFIIRITHWVNVAAFLVMVGSGLRIYNASPIFALNIPPGLTLGGWLAGARQWHFLAMWVFFINGTVWVIYNILTNHGRSTTLFSPGDAKGIMPMVRYYLRILRVHPPSAKYNALQKLAYTSVIIIALGVVLSGVAIYWPVQFASVTSIFGGYDAARGWHFFFMSALVLFLGGHLFMVLISGWSNFYSMITGWKRPASHDNGASNEHPHA